MHQSILLVSFLLLLTACSSKEEENQTSNQTETMTSIDWQGHRGARGLLPENTIPSFILALEFPNIKTLELDLAVSKDLQLVLSHEPWMSSMICLQANGQTISEELEKEFKIYQMDYEEVLGFDCGSKPHPRFPEQKNSQLPKPLLRQIVEAADAHAKTLGRPLPFYNIEIKSKPEWDDIFTPKPDQFAKLLYQEIQRLNIAERTTVQSFDRRSLQAMHQLAPKQSLALLVENTWTFKKNLDSLGFIPQIYSPNHLLVSANLVEKVHRKGMQIIPWTVNKTVQMQGLLDLGVDGIITDYPNRIPNIN